MSEPFQIAQGMAWPMSVRYETTVEGLDADLYSSVVVRWRVPIEEPA